VDTKLVINPAEAKTVRHIFERYLALGSVGAIKAELDKDGYITKLRNTKKQIQCGGRPFSRGHLYKLFCNPVYIGMIKHKDKVYAGEHEPILEMDLWDSVQSALKATVSWLYRLNNTPIPLTTKPALQSCWS